jgi:hypothetical protein
VIAFAAECKDWDLRRKGSHSIMWVTCTFKLSGTDGICLHSKQAVDLLTSHLGPVLETA